jgi:hypothetical protein
VGIGILYGILPYVPGGLVIEAPRPTPNFGVLGTIVRLVNTLWPVRHEWRYQDLKLPPA